MKKPYFLVRPLLISLLLASPMARAETLLFTNYLTYVNETTLPFWLHFYTCSPGPDQKVPPVVGVTPGKTLKAPAPAIQTESCNWLTMDIIINNKTFSCQFARNYNPSFSSSGVKNGALEQSCTFSLKENGKSVKYVITPTNTPVSSTKISGGTAYVTNTTLTVSQKE